MNNPASKRHLVTLGLAALIVVVLCSVGTLATLVLVWGGTPTRTVRITPIDSSDPTTTPPAARPALAPGDIALRVDDGKGVILATLTKAERRTTACDQYSPAPTHGAYLIVTVTASVISGTASINPLYFLHVAPNGITADAFGGVMSGCGTALASGNDLPVGTVRQGQVVFDLDPANLGAVAYVSPLGTPLGSWDVR